MLIIPDEFKSQVSMKTHSLSYLLSLSLTR